MSRKVTYNDDKKKEYAGRLLGGIFAFCIKRFGFSEDTAKNIGEELGGFLSGIEIKDNDTDTTEHHWDEALNRMWIQMKEIDLPEEFWLPLENELFRTNETMALFLEYYNIPKGANCVSDCAERLRLIIESIHMDSTIIDMATIPEDLSKRILESLKREVKKDISLDNYIETTILKIQMYRRGLLENHGNQYPYSLPILPTSGGLIEDKDNNQNTQSDRAKINRYNRKKAIDHEYNTPVINIFRERMTWGILIQNELYRTQQFVMRKNIKIHSADELLKKYKQTNLLITGEAGYGKTAAFEYIFLKYGLNDETPVYYLPAYIFTRGKDEITHLQKAIRNLIEAGEKVEGLLLIDGLEEAYLNNYIEASSKIKLIAESGTVFWMACRPDFYENLDLESDGYFKEIAHVRKWEREDFNEFVSKYEHYYEMVGVSARIESIVNNSVMETTSIYRPLYAMLFLYLATEELEDENDEYVIKNEYDLIEQFINLWFKRESKRDKKEYYLEDYLPELRKLAIGVYEYKRPKLEYRENVISGLVVVNKRSNKPLVEKFCHREFCIFFIAEGIIDGMLKGDIDLIHSFSHLYYDDVTNLCKVALRTYSRYTKRMYSNMFNIYKQTYELNRTFVSLEAKEIISKYNELQLLLLRDEIIYYIMRLPDVVKICNEFAEYAVAHINGNIMISLGLAYSLATVVPHPHTFEFARKLKPGSPEDLRNRSWALVFFGDVPGYDEFEGYTYEDDGTSKWTNVRRMRWERLRNNTPSYYRSRILDIPFLYCFYASRGFNDCNSRDDLIVIENCDISNYEYTAEERAFLVEQKRILVEAYRENLRKREGQNI